MKTQYANAPHTHEKSENKEQIWKDQIPTSDGTGNIRNPSFYHLKIFQIVEHAKGGA